MKNIINCRLHPQKTNSTTSGLTVLTKLPIPVVHYILDKKVLSLVKYGEPFRWLFLPFLTDKYPHVYILGFTMLSHFSISIERRRSLLRQDQWLLFMKMNSFSLFYLGGKFQEQKRDIIVFSTFYCELILYECWQSRSLPHSELVLTLL